VQSPCLFRTPKVVLLATPRDMRPQRSGVALAHSFDDGLNWRYADPLYVPADQSNRDCSYPTMAALGTGEIMCAYYSAFANGTSDIEAVFLHET